MNPVKKNVDFLKPQNFGITRKNEFLQTLDDLLNINNPYFEGMVNQNYPPELQLNKANTSDTQPPFWIYISLFQTALFPPKFMINVITLILI